VLCRAMCAAPCRAVPCRAVPCHLSAAPVGTASHADALQCRSLPAACTAPPLQPPSRIFLLTGPRGNGQSALVHLIAKDLPNCLHIRAGDLVGNYRLSCGTVCIVDLSTGTVLWHRALLWSTPSCAHTVEDCGPSMHSALLCRPFAFVLCFIYVAMASQTQWPLLCVCAFVLSATVRSIGRPTSSCAPLPLRTRCHATTLHGVAWRGGPCRTSN
jgi:hypothetical protein